jgi:hypothetical protein
MSRPYHLPVKAKPPSRNSTLGMLVIAAREEFEPARVIFERGFRADANLESFKAVARVACRRDPPLLEKRNWQQGRENAYRRTAYGSECAKLYGNRL